MGCDTKATSDDAVREPPAGGAPTTTDAPPDRSKSCEIFGTSGVIHGSIRGTRAWTFCAGGIFLVISATTGGVAEAASAFFAGSVFLIEGTDPGGTVRDSVLAPSPKLRWKLRPAEASIQGSIRGTLRGEPWPSGAIRAAETPLGRIEEERAAAAIFSMEARGGDGGKEDGRIVDTIPE